MATEIVKRNGIWVHEICPTTSYHNKPQPIPTNAQDIIAQLYAEGNVNSRVPVMSAPMIDDLPLADVAFPKIEKTAGFTPSRYQQALFDEIRHGSGNIVMAAGPGSGKTTTIVKALELTSSADRVAFLAFNKHIAKELSTRCPPHVHVSTLHSLGYSILRRWNSKIEMDEDKTGRILDAYYPTSKEAESSSSVRRENRTKRYGMRKLVSICKAVLADPAVDNMDELIDRYSIEIDDAHREELIKLLPEVLRKSRLDFDQVMDYDDMIWLPLVRKLSFDKFDYLFVDEAQDLNKSQIEFVLNSVAEKGRIICVGDKYQSMYAFRGADSDAIPNLISRLHAKVLPLSVSYRCPVTHIHRINAVVGSDRNALVEPAPNAKDGSIADVKEIDLVSQLLPGDMVLCRTNAPLIEPAFACVRAGKKAMIRGRDIGKALIDLIERFRADTLEQLDVSLEEYFQREYNRFLEKGKELQADLLGDKVTTLRFVMHDSREVSEVISKIRMLFSDDNIGVVFSSVHRAKGLEAERVFILHEELMPHPKAKEPWELDQERNCQYVAFSRSKDQMYFVR